MLSALRELLRRVIGLFLSFLSGIKVAFAFYLNQFGVAVLTACCDRSVPILVIACVVTRRSLDRWTVFVAEVLHYDYLARRFCFNHENITI